MKHNTLKDKIARGVPAIGASIALPSPDLVDFCGFLGFEYITMDAESSPIGPPTCLTICRVCEAHGMVPIVKVPRLDPELIALYLRTGAVGILVPHINTAEAAEAVVRAARYPPEGQRGCDIGCRSSGYAPVEIDPEYFARSNREILVGVLVEDTTGMANLDEILQVSGVGAVYIGPGDLARSTGYRSRDHPTVQEAIAEARRKILAAGKGLPGYAPELNPSERVWRLLKPVELKNVCCSDWAHLRSELRKAIARLRRRLPLLQSCVTHAGLPWALLHGSAIAGHEEEHQL